MQISQLILAEWQQESANTRKMLERIPAEKFGWRPHDKSMTLGRLTTHIAELPVWFTRVIEASEFDFMSVVFKPYTAESSEELLDLFDKQIASSIAVLERADDDTMNALWTLRRGEQIMMTVPRKAALRTFALNHIYHHRGQVSIYLRMLDIPVPGMYGPSADERKALL